MDLKTVVDVFSQSIHVGRDDRVPNALCRPFRQCYGISSVYTESTEAQSPGMLGVTTQFQNARCHSTHLANLLYMSAVWSEVKHESNEVKHESSEVKHESNEVKHESSEVKHESSQVKHESSEVKHETSQVKHESLHVIVAAKPVRQHTYSSVRHHSYTSPTHHMSLRYQIMTQNQNMQSHLRNLRAGLRCPKTKLTQN